MCVITGRLRTVLPTRVHTLTVPRLHPCTTRTRIYTLHLSSWSPRPISTTSPLVPPIQVVTRSLRTSVCVIKLVIVLLDSSEGTRRSGSDSVGSREPHRYTESRRPRRGLEVHHLLDFWTIRRGRDTPFKLKSFFRIRIWIHTKVGIGEFLFRILVSFCTVSILNPIGMKVLFGLF